MFRIDYHIQIDPGIIRNWKMIFTATPILRWIAVDNNCPPQVLLGLRLREMGCAAQADGAVRNVCDLYRVRDDVCVALTCLSSYHS